jgi:DNA adenine methylase
VKPLFIWAGGKNKLLKDYADFLPQNFDKYSEPFLGGGAMFIWAYNKNPNAHFYLNDLNEHIIGVYTAIKENPEDFLNILDKLCEEYLSLPKGEPCKELEKKHKKKYNVVDWKKVFEEVPSKRHYYFMKRNEYQFDYDKWKDNPVEEAANLYFLMKTGFNGIWQTKTWSRKTPPPAEIEKAVGRFNTPCGLLNQGLNEETGNFKEVYEKKDVLAWHKALQNCTLTSRDFKDTFEFIDKDSYVFLDPPYRQLPDEKKQKKPQVKKEKLQYGVSFDDKLQESVLDYFNSAKEKGAYVLLSNRDVGDGFFEKRLRNNKIHPIEVTYTAGRRKKTENGFEAKKAKEILMY